MLGEAATEKRTGGLLPGDVGGGRLKVRGRDVVENEEREKSEAQPSRSLKFKMTTLCWS